MLEKQITLAFALNNGYDSLAECKFHLNNKHLNLITDKPYKMTFYDNDGESFTAYPDFYDPKTQLVIEFKDYKLNTHSTKKSSEERRHQREKLEIVRLNIVLKYMSLTTLYFISAHIVRKVNNRT